MLDGIRICIAVVLSATALCAASASAQFVEDFESYPASAVGVTFTPGGLMNSGGWYQFGGYHNEENRCFTSGGPVAAHGGGKYVGTQLDGDSIHRFSSFTAGRWDIRFWTYVPGPASSQPMLDGQWAVFLNEYND